MFGLNYLQIKQEQESFPTSANESQKKSQTFFLATNNMYAAMEWFAILLELDVPFFTHTWGKLKILIFF